MEFDEAVFEFMHSTWEEYDMEMHCDAISGELMDKVLVEAARKIEMETCKKRRAYEKVPTEERWRYAGKSPVGAKWADANRGDKENPEHRCRLVAKDLKKHKHEDLFAATPPLKANKMLFSLWASMPGMCLEF